ncbi:MAG: TPR domain-containing protein [Anaerolineaceae bacterium]|nr:MAG: TPR domain-containing protein [Anaerolineaceae bacterium]
MKKTIVFISYSHDSPEHANRILELANRLRADGIDVTIDQYVTSPAEGWPKWMDRQITNSDFVLVACTETYYRRVMGEEEQGKGLGIKWESTITYQDIYDANSENTKFIPILFEDGKTDFIPKPLKGATFYFLPKQYEDLYRRLTNQPKIQKPELGQIKKLESLPALERKTDFFEGTVAGWHLAHPYPMPPNFTGRAAERALLTRWLTEDSQNRLFILCALGGFGKSALAWHWLTNDVDPQEWPKVLWWSFYEGDASFEHFVEETLKYLKRDVPQNKRAQVDELLKAMSGQKTLLILDGFERALRAYSSMSAAYQGDEEQKFDDNQFDCVDVNAETFLKSVCSLPQMQGKVLMTTRLTPRAVQPRGEFLQGCCEVELTAMDKADAVAFFHAQGIQGTHTEIEAACETYGYHPLSLRLLAGRILKDFENPGDIVVAQKLKIDGDIIQQKHHVLEVSYNSLPASEQKLLSTIACFRSAVELKTIEAIDVGADGIRPGGHRPPLQTELHDLVDRGLLHFDDKNKKFDLHPIVRRYAYDRLTAADRTGAHERLVNYFAAVPKPEKVEKLEDLAPVIELYHHMVRAGNLDEALKLFYDRLQKAIYYQFGAYQLQVELLRALFLDDEDKPPRLKREDYQRWTLNELGNTYVVSGQSRRSVPLFEMQNNICEKQGDKKNLAITLGNMATQQLVIGALSAAERNLRRQIDLCREIADEGVEAAGHLELGRVLSYRSVWQEAEQELSIAERVFDKYGAGQTNYVSVIRAYHAQRFLLMVRSNPQSSIENLKSSIEYAKLALELADEVTRRNARIPRDYVRAYWLLGAAYRANNELTLAEENLSKALNLCRQINMVDHEADILLDLARLRYAQGDFKDVQEKASEALMITERSGYVLQGADVNLFLAELALTPAPSRSTPVGLPAGEGDPQGRVREQKELALRHAKAALKLATCDGPPYYYKVAYEEAERMIEKLK